MLQLLKNLRSHSQGKEITDADILVWANKKLRNTGRTSQIGNFKVKHTLAFFLLYINHHIPHYDFYVVLLILKSFRIRACQVVYSSLTFLVQWSQEWSTGTLLPRVKVV